MCFLRAVARHRMMAHKCSWGIKEELRITTINRVITELSK